MKLSKASDYALVLLARMETFPKEEWVSVRKVAGQIGIPNRFLSNIVHKLVQAGILESHRGAHGGVKLAKRGDEITIGSVLQALHDPMGLVDCITHPGLCPLEKKCDVQRFWSVTHGLILSALKHITLKEMSGYLKGEEPWSHYSKLKTFTLPLKGTTSSKD